MSDLYVAWRKVIRRISRAPYRTYNDIVIKLGGNTVSRLDRRLAKFLFSLINHDNPVVQNKTKFKLGCPRTTLAENKFSHLDFYTGNILCKTLLVTVDDGITHTELCELRDHGNTCKLVSPNMIHILLGELCRVIIYLTYCMIS